MFFEHAPAFILEVLKLLFVCPELVKNSGNFRLILRARLNDVVNNLQRLRALNEIFLSLDDFFKTDNQFSPVFVIQAHGIPAVYCDDVFKEDFAQASIHWGVDFACIDQAEEGR